MTVAHRFSTQRTPCKPFFLAMLLKEKDCNTKGIAMSATKDNQETAPVQNLDQLIEILGEDDLRNIAGGDAARPKGRAIMANDSL